MMLAKVHNEIMCITTYTVLQAMHTKKLGFSNLAALNMAVCLAGHK